MHKVAGPQVDGINIKENHGQSGEMCLLDTICGDSLFIELSVEKHIGIASREVGIHILGDLMDGTLRVILGMHGVVAGVGGIGAKKIRRGI
jgi:hypothetical protein